MAIAPSISTSSAMNNNNKNQEEESNMSKQDEVEHDDELHDMVMPGFRFHPTEEELVEFYLRRKVEGKRFNVELITFLDLYRYDPWELPGLAAIGEKEWYFYVPRDRKYRNGDRPNRVTTSGYWKATGADRMIRSENFRSIGLKKTLVFYSGKAPKGIRTSWIMNEYRLPTHETERLQKAEISLCRVYKRAGVEDHPSLPRSTARDSPSSSSRGPQPPRNHHEPDQASKSRRKGDNSFTIAPLIPNIMPSTMNIPPPPITSLKDPNCIFDNSNSSSQPINNIDDLHKLVNTNYSQQASLANLENQPNMLSHFSSQLPPPPPVAMNVVSGSFQATFSDKLWDWNGIPETSKDFNNMFK